MMHVYSECTKSAVIDTVWSYDVRTVVGSVSEVVLVGDVLLIG